jgi:hypothetical protein
MAHDSTHAHPPTDKVELSPGAGGAAKIALVAVGVIGLAVAVFTSTDPGFGRFYHAYLVSYAFILSLALGGLFFTMIQHLVAAAWSVVVRRIAETLAWTLPVLALGALPLIWTVNKHDVLLYPWAVDMHNAPAGEGEHHASAPTKTGVTELPGQLADASNAGAATLLAQHAENQTTAAPQPETAATETHDKESADGAPGHEAKSEKIGYHAAYEYADYGEMTKAKQPWLSPMVWTIRIAGYFVVWTILAWYFYGKSTQQDKSGDYTISQTLRKRSAPAIFVFALTVTFAAFDIIMSLDHHWFSTMFGVYFFAGAMIATHATLIVTSQLLQRRAGALIGSVTKEHYHDMGKFMFAFIFFWGYVHFSQYMLQWYANIPEATPWWARHGASAAYNATNNIGFSSGYGSILLIILFGHFIFPFAYLMSRHIKRSREALLIGAIWMLTMHWIDLYWLVMPELDNGKFFLGLPEIGAAVGLISLFAALVWWKLGTAPLRPTQDPRLPESLAFHNI